MLKYIALFPIRYLLLLLFAYCSLFTTIAQEPQKKDLTAPETPKEKILEKKQGKKLYSISQFVHETSLFVKQPTKWIGSDWLKLGIVTAATFSAMPFDKNMADKTQGNQKYYYSAPMVGGRIYGEWYSIAGVAGAFGLYGLVAQDNGAKKITLELLQAGIYSEAVTEVFKVIIGRARPSTNEDAFTFHPFTVKNDFNSMPSGHATSSMALSTVMSRHAPTTFLKILAYVPAAVTMYSRIYQNKHWLSDVVPGAAIGFATGNWVVDLHEGKRHKINVTSVYPPSVSYSFNQAPAYK
jgi:hypothetical protein